MSAPIDFDDLLREIGDRIADAEAEIRATATIVAKGRGEEGEALRALNAAVERRRTLLDVVALVEGDDEDLCETCGMPDCEEHSPLVCAICGSATADPLLRDEAIGVWYHADCGVPTIVSGDWLGLGDGEDPRYDEGYRVLVTGLVGGGFLGGYCSRAVMAALIRYQTDEIGTDAAYGIDTLCWADDGKTAVWTIYAGAWPCVVEEPGEEEEAIDSVDLPPNDAGLYRFPEWTFYEVAASDVRTVIA